MTLKVSGRARNIFIHQTYAPNMDDHNEEVDKLYRSIELEGKWQTMKRHSDSIRRFYNEMGQRLNEFGEKENIFICNM